MARTTGPWPSTKPPASRGSTGTKSQRHGRFLTVFFVSFLFGYAALATPWLKPAVVCFDRVLVHSAGIVIRLCRGRAEATGAVLRSPSTGLGVEMKDGCDGVNVTLLLCAALLAFPSSRTLKIKGLLAGCLAIQCVNLVRFISLFYLLQYNRAWFDFAHDYLWESLIMLDALAVFWLWAQLVFRSAGARQAHA